METINLSNIKGDYNITTYLDYVILTGPQLIVFKSNGTFVAQYSSLGAVYKVLPITNDTILADCTAKGFYALISLKSGSEYWRIPQPRLDYTYSRFVLSPDKQYAYDLYDLRGKCYSVRINLTEKKLYKSLVKKHFSCISDLICGKQGVPFFLEHQYKEHDDETSRGVSQNGIIRSRFTELRKTSHYEVLYQWEFKSHRISQFFLESEDAILTQDLHIYVPSTGTIHPLIENDNNWKSPGKRPAGCRLDGERYITLKYNTVNVIVDRTTRSMCARYSAKYRFGGIVGEEYWVCTDEGIIRKPFPAIEQIPDQKHTFWSPWH